MKKKTNWVFVFQKYGKFRSVLLGHFIKHKPLISEEWFCIYVQRKINSHVADAERELKILTHAKNYFSFRAKFVKPFLV